MDDSSKNIINDKIGDRTDIDSKKKIYNQIPIKIKTQFNFIIFYL